MHFFGLWGTLMFLIGFISVFYIVVSKLYRLFFLHLPTRLVAENPWFFIALTTMIIGSLFFIGGFLGEIIIRTNPNPERYKISDKSN